MLKIFKFELQTNLPGEPQLLNLPPGFEILMVRIIPGKLGRNSTLNMWVRADFDSDIIEPVSFNVTYTGRAGVAPNGAEGVHVGSDAATLPGDFFVVHVFQLPSN